ncbi:ABC transporter permease [Streptomyces sp. NPDC051018]|uniref:ABC transporter permease n=1 Tax=Streptomyces sp. NPDC051018 TaxID=3365639 RepID=UPI0037BB0286
MSFVPVVHSEWLKIRTVRSLPLSLLAAFLATAGFSLLMSGSFNAEQVAEPGFDPLRAAFYGLNFGAIGALCFGALAVAGEYKTGGIRSSLAAVPRRGVFYAAKLAVVAVLTFAVGLVTSLICFLAGQALLSGQGVSLGLGDPGTVRAVVGCALYLTLIAVMATGLTTASRSAPMVIGLLIPFMVMLSFVAGDITDEGNVFTDFFPDRAGQQILLQNSEGTLGPWTGVGVLALWTGAAVWAGWSALHRRDA